jgi:hypothetical protein
MSPQIPEPDWKLLRTLREAALQRAIVRALDESAALIADESRTPSERYHALHDLLRARDRVIASAFDAPSRSNAMLQLMQLHALGLLREDEISRFTPETRGRLRVPSPEVASNGS